MDLSEIFRWPPTPARWAALKTHLRASAVTAGHGLRMSRSSAGTMLSTSPQPGSSSPAARGPFFLSVSKVESNWKWEVSEDKSSVTDGLNGNLIDLGSSGSGWSGSAIKFGVKTTIASTKWIVLQCQIDGGWAASNWTLAAVDNRDEAVFVDGEQTHARLLIGRVKFSGSPATAEANQSVMTAQRLIHGIINGYPVRVFEAAPFIPA
jgi:hypothetical protein